MSDTATLLLLFTWFVPAPSCDLGEYRALTSCLQVNAGNLDIQSDKDQLCVAAGLTHGQFDSLQQEAVAHSHRRALPTLIHLSSTQVNETGRTIYGCNCIINAANGAIA